MEVSGQMDMLQTGTTLGGRYLITGTLGKGGMGIVYAAKDMKLGGLLRAVKIPSGFGGARGADQLEASLLTKLNHPLLPQIVDCVPLSSHKQVALVMDYFPGQTLHDCYEGLSRPFAYKHVLQIGLQLCSALSYLHQRQPSIIHRDLKPSNVMINQEGVLKLIDFGISCMEVPDVAERTIQLGTAEFAAPERAAGLAGDARTDVYGLGALLRYLTGSRNLMTDRTRTGQMDYPSAFWSVLRIMLEPDPDNRYPTMSAAWSELQILEKHRQVNDTISVVEDQLPWKVQSRTPLVSVLSLSAGAGATFLTFALTELLAGQGVNVTAAEMGTSRPEWQSLLSGQEAGIPRKLQFVAEEGLMGDCAFTLFRRRDNLVNLYALRQRSYHSIETSRECPWKETKEDIRIADISSYWNEPQSQAALEDTRIVIVIGDPAVYKWQAGELAALERLSSELNRRGGALVWVANKAARFKGLNEWLPLFPAKPLAVVSEIMPSKLWQAYWSGRLLPPDKSAIRLLQRELEPIIRLIRSQIST